MDPNSSNNDTVPKGPLSRTWPQLFKKRRRQHSPVRDSAVSVSTRSVSTVSTDTSSEFSTSSGSGMSRSTNGSVTSASTMGGLNPTRPAMPKIPISRTGSVAFTDSSSISGMSATSPPMGPSQCPATSTNPQADTLASKSNYELISSGQHVEMGLNFSSAMATGVMMKRATHRAAEQARRDRMKTAMVDLAEHLLDGEVTFGSGTTSFVVMMKGKTDGEGSEDAGGKEKGEKGEKRTVNKARLIEMALEKLIAQEKELEILRREVEACSCRMDISD